MKRFIGREEELEWLRGLLSKQSASFVVIRGRRRIGKSRLIQEFGRGMPCYVFSGLPPRSHMTKKSQIAEFCSQMASLFDLPKFSLDDWGEVFRELGKRCRQGRVVLALDEISWIGSKSPDFLGQLKNAWDLHFSHNPELILIVCGSVSSWITKNILGSTGFVGRISVDLQLEELAIGEVGAFWNSQKHRLSAYDLLQVLAVTGGVPKYLEEIRPKLSAEQNIRALCFHKNGFLFGEFDRIFHDLFTSDAGRYVTLLEAICERPRTLTEVATATGLPSSTASDHMNDLVHAGFVRADPVWNLKKMKTSRIRRFRLSDNYIRFYLKYILNNRDSINQGLLYETPLAALPNWKTIMGLQFENLVLGNVHALIKPMHLKAGELVLYGPYFQQQTLRTQACQVDLLLQTRFRTLFLCEIKFSSGRIGADAVRQMEKTVERIALPRGWSKRTVLIHVNGVTEEAVHGFDHVIDFSQLLNLES